MTSARAKPIGLTVYCTRAGDHNDRAMAGAMSVGTALANQLGIAAKIIGTPGAALNTGWAAELAAAMPGLTELAARLDELLNNKLAPLSALSRCATALATLPIVMRYRPDACVVWFDAHGDLNTPDTSMTGYLGGMALAGPAGLWDSGLGNGLPLANIILVGARDLDPAERHLVDAGAVRLVPAQGNSASALRAALAGRPAYLHLDCDVLQPGIVPTDYRVPGGFTLAQLGDLCRVLAEVEIVGIEIAEFENAWSDDGAPASTAGLLAALGPALDRLGLASGNAA